MPGLAGFFLAILTKFVEIIKCYASRHSRYYRKLRSIDGLLPEVNEVARVKSLPSKRKKKRKANRNKTPIQTKPDVPPYYAIPVDDDASPTLLDAIDYLHKVVVEYKKYEMETKIDAMQLQ
jgi:hypothetical protein